MTGRQFPVAGVVGEATPATRLRWFAAAHTTRRRVVGGEPVDWPASTVHAKQMGRGVTACGLPTMSWPKLFGMRFPVRPGETCHDCARVVAESTRP